MASTSYSSSVPSIHRKYDVFLSFRGFDTRHSFTDHLYYALLRVGLRTFRDNDEIDRGQQLKPEIEKAIMESRASIIVLSENYPNSRWCLDELVLILEQRRNLNHFVLPVFYHVVPSDVRNQRHSFAIESDQRVDQGVNDVNRWRAALTEVADLTGIVISGLETEFIEKIINTLYNALDLKLLSTPPHLTGMDTRAEGINSWLRADQSGAEALAICGMGGIGKTTLAQYIYNSNKQNFESNSFLMEIGKHYKQPNGLFGLQKQLLTDITGVKNEKVFSSPEITSKIEDALQMKRVLIVLDDIDDQDQIDALLGTKTLHTKIKIVITTRHLDIQAWFGSISCKCRVYKLKFLNDQESLELLSFHAFGSKVPMEDFKDLARPLARYCEGNPLALKVLGSSLYVSAEDPNETERCITNWISQMNSLSSLKGDLDNKILRILKTSYDSLPRVRHKELFLHIAFFFVGEYEDDVVQILEQDWHARAGITTLINRCLLTVSPSNKLMMHQLLQEMGRTIVHEESNDPAERSRVCQDEAYRVLGKGEGSKKVEGLALDMRKIEQGTRSERQALKTASFAKMDYLKLLQLKDVKLTGSYKKFPQLTWLCWHECCLKRIPSGLLTSSLVAIDMSEGKFKKFETPTVLNLLKTLNLKHCWNLVTIRNLNRMPNLETLILWDCTSLSHICKTIAGLERLTLLDLTGCENLLKVSSKKKFLNRQQIACCCRRGIPQQQLFSLPHSLKFLFLNNFNLEKLDDFPMVFSGQPFFYINLGNNPFKFLPNNIDLKMLRVLNLTSCHNLKSLLCLPSTLQELYTYHCTSLEKITFQSARFRLREFGYEGCLKLCVIQGLFKLVFIDQLEETDLGHMKWIKAFQDHQVQLVGDEITIHRRQHIQMLYEYGIMSTYLWHIEDENMISEYMSESPFLSFQVPLCPDKRTIQGLHISSAYRSLVRNEDQDECVLCAKVSNKSKGLTWIYNPVVYCKPVIEGDAIWLSYWPIGNILDPGDEVDVSIIVGNGLIVSRCGATLVYTDCELEQEKESENNATEEEVIGGDLSEFELTTGVYYLCRRNLLKSMSPHWLEMLVDGTFHYKELQGWRKSRQPLTASFTELKTFRHSLRVEMANVGVGHGGDAGGDPPERWNWVSPGQCRGAAGQNVRGGAKNQEVEDALAANGGMLLWIRFEGRDQKTFRAVGDHAVTFNNLLGSAVRRIPFYFHSWKTIPDHYKEEVWQILLSYFNLHWYLERHELDPMRQGAVNGINHTCSERYRNSKNRFKEHWYTIPLRSVDLQTLRMQPPPGMSHQMWGRHVDFFWGDRSQRLAQVNTQNRQHQPYVATTACYIYLSCTLRQLSIIVGTHAIFQTIEGVQKTSSPSGLKCHQRCTRKCNFFGVVGTT